MNHLEEQLRRYAGAITADKALIPERPPGHRHPTGSRGPFFAAAAVLIAVLVVGAAVALGSRDDTPTSAVATATEGDLTTTLEVSTTEPGSDTVVTATVTVANNGASELQMPAGCRLVIGVVTDPPDQLQFPSGSEALSYGAQAQYGNGIFRPQDKQVFPTLTIDDLAAFAAGDPEPVTRKADSCENGDRTATTLGPGESIAVTKALAVGSLGLRGNAEIKTVIPALGQNGNPAVSIRLPEPTAQPINRSDAINLALAQPEVVALIESLPPEDGPGVTTSTLIAWPVRDGWQVGYGDETNGIAFLVDINPSGDVTHLDTHPPTP